jgi:hypothetical protein
VKELIVACAKYVDARILRRAVSPGTPVWQIRLIKAYWALRGGTAERELALRWLPSRYRLMVADTESGPWVERIREISGKRIPIFTRRGGERRKAEFLQLHPDCVARLEADR